MSGICEVYHALRAECEYWARAELCEPGAECLAAILCRALREHCER